ncbi:hypothetical protein G7074_21520 [Pedobacter sp. HDW13]|uniref:PHB depolymerase family esterase n=1 Tax=Pedobacter sp. HDW13 TaxID=2714940 RepID=UPI00140D40B4|nr:PHB depolymerase family esterase [Pedobacter sp. HDW13]QIL41615.1 hypothetical protein G7074_21520 [Pedobacter sp. HDW13]
MEEPIKKPASTSKDEFMHAYVRLLTLKNNKTILRIIFNFCGLCLAFISLDSCKKNVLPVNDVPDVQRTDGSIMIRNWLLTGPFLDSTKFNQDGYKDFSKSSIFSSTNSINYYQAKDYIPLNSVLNTNKQAGSYAACTIKSEVEQDVALLFGMHGSLKLWLNSKLVREETNPTQISKNRYIVRVHLKKGNNDLLVKLFSQTDAQISWTFHLDVASIDYVRKYAFGADFFSISEHYLIGKDNSLSLRFKYPAFIPSTRPVQLQIKDVTGHTVINKTLPAGKHWSLALNDLKNGAYKCRLIADLDTIQQCFIFGDHRKVFNEYQSQIKPMLSGDINRINVETLFQRFRYMDDFGTRNQYGEWLERKISATLFELGTILNKLSLKKEPYSRLGGLHIRGFRSSIDQSVDNYMVYIPQRGQLNKKLPLVMMMPYVTKQEPFLESWHVADITRIELISRLADKYGFGVLWPSARIYRDYNLNPIASSATFEALSAIKKNYHIDDNRIFLYGDCSGGLQALLIANRFPSFFAGIGVEGPELGYTQSDRYPGIWIQANNIIQTAENYKNIPMLIYHTPNDRKADFSIIKQLVNTLKKASGKVHLDTLNNATKEHMFKLVSEEVVISQIFGFFKDKQRHCPDTINFSTYQLKYNKSSWITVNDKEYGKKAKVYAFMSGKNSIKLTTANVNKLTIDLRDVLKIDKKDPISVICNQKKLGLRYPVNGRLVLELTPPKKSKLLKTQLVEGPINDVFKNGFIVVAGTLGTPDQNETIHIAANTIYSNWKEDFFNDCETKKDVDINKLDLQNKNLILIGSEKTNGIIKRFANQIPLKVTGKYIEINGKKHLGESISYNFVYPNPVNSKKYVLIIGANYNRHLWSHVKDLPLRGWYDYEVWGSDSMVEAGYFNRYWGQSKI